MKPKLLIVTSTFPRWQDDTDPPFVYELSKRLTDTFDVTVHTPNYPGAKTEEMAKGIKIHRFRYFFAPSEKLAGTIGILPTLKSNKKYYGVIPFFLFFQFISLLILIKKTRPDVIHAHWLIPQGFSAVIMQNLMKVPVVVTAHGADIYSLQSTLFNAIKRYTLKRVSNITVVSKPLAEKINEMITFDIQPQVIPMGVDHNKFSPDRKSHYIREKYSLNGPFLLYVGRLTEKKGVKYLIDAMPSVLSQITDAKLIIIGSGELEEKLKKQVIDIGLSDHVIFTGSILNKDLPDYYASADIFIGPSIAIRSGDTEGFGLTFVEAAMSGCLLIGTDVGGIGDIIKNNVTGFLVSQKSHEALSNCITNCLANGSCNKRIRENSRQYCIDNFTWAVIAQQYRTLLQSAVNKTS